MKLHKSGLTGRIRNRLKWLIQTRHQIPAEVHLWAAPQIRLKVISPETGNLVLWAQRRNGLAENLLRFEVPETRVFLERIKKASIFFDIGAHIGYYSLIAASQPNIERVVAFEILEAFAKEIRFHVKNNGFSNISVESAGIGDGQTVIEFGNLIAKGRKKSVSLDAYIERHGVQPDLIKMDVEGFEGLALEGARQTLERLPELFLSVHPQYLERLGGKTEKVIELLYANYQHIYQIDERDTGQLDQLLIHRSATELVGLSKNFVLWCSPEPIK